MPLKEFHAPHLGRKVKLGRRRPVARCPRMSIRSYLKDVLPAPPASCNYAPAASPVLRHVYLNDQLGDCVIAAGYHIVGVETGNAGSLFTATDQQIITDYSAIGGYVPGNPSTDQGCDEQTALNYWTQNGFADGSKLVGWMAVDGTNSKEVMQAMYLFENLLFGIELPDAWISPFPAGDGFIWDVGTPDPWNGHAVCGVGYDAKGVQVDTWGLIGTITWDAIAQLCTANGGGELYVMLTPDQLAKGQTKAPNGVDWAELLADFTALGGNPPAPSPAPPAPPPDPQPPTPPAPPAPQPPAPGSVTLEQAIEWATQGLIDNWPSDS